MPFEPTYNYWTDRLDGYIWTVDPNVAEEDMRDIEPRIQHLTIAPLDPDNPVKPRIPSLEFFDRGSLETLTLKEMDVRDMPVIPPTVRVLEVMRTNLRSLTELRVDWEGIRCLQLVDNRLFTNTSLILPEGPTALLIGYFGYEWIHTEFDVIRLPSTIQRLYLSNVSVNLITGFIPNRTIHFNDTTICPKYRIHYQQTIQDEADEHEVEPPIADFGDDPEPIDIDVNSSHRQFTLRILKTNTEYNYSMFSDFGAVINRIRNPLAHKEEPIVQALFLRSNYLRRAAEFMTENTFI